MEMSAASSPRVYSLSAADVPKPSHATAQGEFHEPSVLGWAVYMERTDFGIQKKKNS